MNLYILRHGIAEEREEWTGPDSDRPLTEKGQRRVRKIAAAMDRLGLEFQAILSSPYARALKTAEIVAERLGLEDCLHVTDALIDSAGPEQLVGEIRDRHASATDVCIVGHEPFLSGLISILLTGSTQVAIELKKGGLCKLSAPAIELGRCATLEWLLAPRQLLRIADGD